MRSCECVWTVDLVSQCIVEVKWLERILLLWTAVELGVWSDGAAEKYSHALLQPAVDTSDLLALIIMAPFLHQNVIFLFISDCSFKNSFMMQLFQHTFENFIEYIKNKRPYLPSIHFRSTTRRLQQAKKLPYHLFFLHFFHHLILKNSQNLGSCQIVVNLKRGSPRYLQKMIGHFDSLEKVK